MTTTTKLLELNDRCNPNYDRCRKCSDPVDSPAFNDTCNRADDLVCDRERNNECRYITDSATLLPLVADEPYELAIGSAYIAASSERCNRCRRARLQTEERRGQKASVFAVLQVRRQGSVVADG